LKLRLSSYIPTKPNAKQAAFLLYDGLEAFYGGAAYGGKSEALLMGALQHVDVPGYAALIVRKSYTDLSLPGALMDRAKAWLQDTDAKWNRETHTWHFPKGSSLTFGYIQNDSDKYRYQSAEFQYIAWDEVTEFGPGREGGPNDAYLFMFSRLRLKAGMEDVPLRVRSASNPIGPGALWVRKRFVDEGPDKQGIFIPAKLWDNTAVDHESYLQSLKKLPTATQNRLVLGSWDEIEDAAFSEFDPTLHIVPPVQAPREWRRWEAMDFGVSNPTAWLAAGLSPEGHTLVYGEYYSPGLVTEHSSKILTLRNFSWGQPSIALCDPSIRNRTGFGVAGRGETIHDEFAKNGINLVPANNDRRAGRVRISELLRPDPSLPFPDWHPWAGREGSPRLFFTSNCTNVIEQTQLAPIDPVEGDTIDPYWESRSGHATAALRYLLTARVYPREIAVTDRFGRLYTNRQWQNWPNWEEVK